LAWLCAATAVLALSVVPAKAAVLHNYLFHFSEVPAEGPLHEPVGLPGPLTLISSMTVDSGHLWIAEDANEGKSRLDEFDATTGAFISQLDHSEGYGTDGIAVGHATGEGQVYVGEGPAVAVFGEAGGLKETWTGAGAPCGSFGGEVTDVAVDNSTSLSDWAAGDVYVDVSSQHVIDVIRPEAGGKAKCVAQLTGISPSEPFESPYHLAVDESNGDVVVQEDAGAGALDIFEPALLGEYTFVRKITGPPPGGSFNGIYNLAVDGGNGDIYVTEGFQPTVIDEFSSTGTYLGRITGAGSPQGAIADVYSLAVDPESHDVYIGDYAEQEEEPSVVDVFGPDVVVPDLVTGAASSITPAAVTLNGTINPDGAGAASCRFEWGTSSSLEEVTVCPTPVANGETPVPVSVRLTGLQPDTTYHYRLQASNADGTNTGESQQEVTTAGPGLRAEASSDVASTSTILDATIDPHDLPTTYYFQYGTDTGYGTDLPAPPGAAIGSGEGDVEVSQQLTGLLVGTTYHYRVVTISESATGVLETFDGPDETFTTQVSGGGVALPDGRAWEMVSPPEKHGAHIFAIGEGGGDEIQASASGDALTYLVSSPIETDPQGYAAGAQVLSTRGHSGWGSRDISPAHATTTSAINPGSEYRFFSSDLSLGIVQPFGDFTPTLSAEASEQTPYLHTDYASGEVASSCSASCYRPLATGKPGYANVPSGTAFGTDLESEYECPPKDCGPEFVDATPDLDHVVLWSPQAALAEPGGDLYEWSGGRFSPISVLPDGEPADSEGEGFLGFANIDVRHAISDDGSRVVWSKENGSDQGLYLRDTEKEETIPLALVREAFSATLRFQIASNDGSRIFFTTTARLTENSGANEKLGWADLYECEIVEVAGKLHCNLSDLTPLTASGRAGVLGLVLGTSEDGSYVYFAADGVLAPGAVPGACNRSSSAATPPGATCNLYVRHDGATKLVAVVSGEDSIDWNEGDASHPPTVMYARASPNGQWLAFMSLRELTGYDNRDAISGERDEEVYLYDASTGRVICASCDPTGGRPVGAVIKEEGEGGSLVDSPHGPDRPPVAASVPGWTSYESDGALYQSRYLSDSGRLFFDSNDALVPEDVNGNEDVYEYEPPGIGNCTTTSATFSVRSGGCVGLISAGTSAEESAFLDASENGDDVFFLTSSKLSAADFDTSLDIYDAHECTAASPCPSAPASQPPPCTTADSCKPAPTPQPAIYGSPSSATFSGAGNVAPAATGGGTQKQSRSKALTRSQQLAKALKTCGRKPKRKRAVCERRARARYAKQAKKANARKRGRG
jgi:hypothetical protein